MRGSWKWELKQKATSENDGRAGGGRRRFGERQLRGLRRGGMQLSGGMPPELTPSAALSMRRRACMAHRAIPAYLHACMMLLRRECTPHAGLCLSTSWRWRMPTHGAASCHACAATLMPCVQRHICTMHAAPHLCHACAATLVPCMQRPARNAITHTPFSRQGSLPAPL